MSTSKTAVLRREADRSRLPLSFAQERLWFLDQWEPGNPVYNVYYAYRLVGRLNVTTLEESVNEIVRRHEVLRTTFGAQEGRPYQVIAGSLHVPRWWSARRVTGVSWPMWSPRLDVSPSRASCAAS
ncbi:MAG: hypothetical protein AMJ93_10765, partial [Anaerolineae bacterium SM23_84]